jgi:hypothetical protein
VDEEHVFAHLKKMKKAALLEYLRAAFEEMSIDQRLVVFGELAHKPPKGRVDGRQLWDEVEQFRGDSLARYYYAPFNITSKNALYVPDETKEWCDRFADLARDACRLTDQEDHAAAVKCFAALYELYEAVDAGKEIIFAEEAGTWMIPFDGKEWLKAYLTSLAATAAPEQFAAAAVPIIAGDSHRSFGDEAYASAAAAATPAQRARLDAELERQHVRTGADDGPG